MRQLLLWGRRFGRTTPRLRTAVSTGLVAMFLFGINTFFDSQSVSADNYVESVLGNHPGMYRYADPVPFGDPASGQFQEWALKAGHDPVLVSRDFPMYELASDGFHYVEREWSEVADTSAVIVAGRLPAEPGEVAVVAPRRDLDRAVLDREVAGVGGTSRLRVVGLLEPSYSDNAALYAAPGTWAGLGAVEDDLVAVSAEAQLLLDDVSPAAADAAAIEGGRALAGSAGDPVPLGDKLGKLVVRADLAAQAPRGWTDRSPVLFVVPGALLPGLVMLVLAASQARRLVPASRILARVGVGLGRSVLAPMLPVLVWAVVGVVCGSLAGTAVGVAAAWLGPWGIARPSAAFPWDAVAATSAGLVVGPLVAWWFLRARVTAGSRSTRGRVRAPGWTTGLRRVVALLTLVGAAHRVATLRSPDDGLVLVCLLLVLVLLVVPELLRAVSSVLPSRLLRDRLVRRLIEGYLPRVAAYVVLVALGAGLATAVVVALQSTVAAEEARQGSTAPPGVVALDNDDAPSLPVDDRVRRAAEQVPSLRGQEPVQLWTSGTATRTSEGARDVADMVTTADGAGVLFAVDSVDDLERLVGRGLSTTEQRLLASGGALVTSPDAAIVGGAIRLVSMTSGGPLAEVPALRVAVRPAPWFVFVAGYVLTDTAEELGVPVARGALVYTEVPAADSRRVPLELAAAGINPEQAEIHRRLPAVLPDAALVGWCVGFLLLLVAVSVVITRSQAESMRSWASRLHLVGVEPGWVRSVLLRQHAVLTGTGLLAGVAAGLGGLVVSHLRLPTLTLEVPWLALGVASLAVVVAPVVALVLSLRVFADFTGQVAEVGE